jgi:hypothetical protein
VPDEPLQAESAKAGTAPPLTYRDPKEDLRPARGHELAGAAVVTALIWVGAVAGLLFLAFAMDYRGEGTPSGIAGTVTALVSGALLLGATVILSLRWHGRPDQRHLSVGIWIGIGIACLVEGVCFVRL